jgi:hypothetical protein
VHNLLGRQVTLRFRAVHPVAGLVGLNLGYNGRTPMLFMITETSNSWLACGTAGAPELALSTLSVCPDNFSDGMSDP